MLTIQKCDAYVRHTLGGPIGAPISAQELVRVTGGWFTTAHEWSFNEPRQELLMPRAAIELTGATWTEGTLTLTKTGAFASYVFVDEDYVKVSAGTGAITGEYEIASRTDDDSIVLVNSIGAAADASTDIAGTMPNNTVTLPADLKTILWIDTDGQDGRGFIWVGGEQFNHARAGRFGFTSRSTRGVIVATQNATTPGVLTYRLEVDPHTTDPKPLLMRYTVGWRQPTDDTDELPLPADGAMDMLFLQALIAHARGLDKEDELPLADRLDALTRSAYWRQHKVRDGTGRTELGPIRGTNIRRRDRYVYGRPFAYIRDN
jgi:hypothetical protein